MDFGQDKQQFIKVIVAEILMVLAVVATVLVLVMIVSGYSINEKLELGRSGLLQVMSWPTGAEVEVDSTKWFFKTNASKILPSGEHEVVLTREGYDSWKKKITISDGLLYRLHYPRLFLKKREKEKVYEMVTLTVASVSPKREALLFFDGAGAWQLADLTKEKIVPKPVEMPQGEPLDITWSRDGNRVLMKLRQDEAIKWVLVDLNNPKNTLQLTEDFMAEIDKIEIMDDTASSLLVLEKGNLRKIDVAGRVMTKPLMKQVEDFDYFEDGVAMVANDEKGRYVGYFDLANEETKRIQTAMGRVKLALNQFYEDKYLVIVDETNVTLLKQAEKTAVLGSTLSFVPEKMRTGRGFVVMSAGNKMATLDMELMKMTEWEVTENNFGWLDSNIIYAVQDGKLAVYDFDGLNHRQLAENVSARFPVMITDNKWLYYWSDGALMREWLISR